MTRTLPMFTDDEDLPLFTGQPVSSEAASFTPKVHYRQLRLGDETMSNGWQGTGFLIRITNSDAVRRATTFEEMMAVAIPLLNRGHKLTVIDRSTSDTYEVIPGDFGTTKENA